jgi:tellurite resistance protein
MTPVETRALLAVALMTAFADGMKDERERARVSSLADRLPVEGIDLPALHHDVANGKLSLDEAARPLAGNRGLALLAYEMAVGVADADGVHTPAEGAFLARLAAALGLPPAKAKEIV